MKVLPGTAGDRLPLIFLILAQDEAAVLRRSLQAVASQMGDSDQLHVVADHCSDNTADIALAEGACVHTRRERGPAGKAAAMRWWVQRVHFPPDQPIVILDADSEIAPGFTEHVRNAMASGAAGVQAKLITASQKQTPLSRLITLSERMEQGFFDRVRALLGGSVRLRGTGMSLRYHLLQRFAPLLQTKAEDVELTLLLAAGGLRILPVFEAEIIDPKPEIPLGAMNQRARWLQGQLEVIRHHHRMILGLIFQVPLGLSLVVGTLVKPRSILSVLRILANAALLMWITARSDSVTLLALLAAVSLLINLPEAVALAFAIWRSPDRLADVKALLALPAFSLLWLRSVLLACITRSPWLRVRPARVPTGLNETAPATN